MIYAPLTLDIFTLVHPPQMWCALKPFSLAANTGCNLGCMAFGDFDYNVELFFFPLHFRTNALLLQLFRIMLHHCFALKAWNFVDYKTSPGFSFALGWVNNDIRVNVSFKALFRARVLFCLFWATVETMRCSVSWKGPFPSVEEIKDLS